jgi:hypothetical protein
MHIILPSPKWDKAVDGIDFSEYWKFAQDLELSLLPANTVFPLAGQIWEAVRDCEVYCDLKMTRPAPQLNKVRLPDGMAVIMQGIEMPGPATCMPWWGAKVPLQKGEQLCVVEADDCGGTSPLRASLQPVRYEELHASIVPEKFRTLPGYKGYRLSVPTARSKWSVTKEGAYLNEDFVLIADVPF